MTRFPQFGHDLRPGTGSDQGEVFSEGAVADPVQPVLDLPVNYCQPDVSAGQRVYGVAWSRRQDLRMKIF